MSLSFHILQLRDNRSISYTLRNSMTSADNGEAPEDISLTRPPSLAFILLNTNLSHIGDRFRPFIMACLLALYAA
ncbi:Os11g0147050 [Oryza sativa Japonica Group]|uniref:Os11g0147050 protein n=1 Tax=Oryza sativa subsp. japonica TaxID=39947 RepID=A0A0P0XZS1_ORYSJ|nr:hypothetical protein EE612_053468 [Oryza sativa]BAT12672.1 Os11g0147050 [Oryza sativa Japonica Group]